MSHSQAQIPFASSDRDPPRPTILAKSDEITTGTIMPVRDLIPIAIARYPHGPTRSQECASAPCERVRLPQD